MSNNITRKKSDSIDSQLCSRDKTRFPRINCLFLREVHLEPVNSKVHVYLISNCKTENQGNKMTMVKTSAEVFNPFPNKPWFLRVCSTTLLKTLQEKEKLLIMSSFSFSHSVFYPFGELSFIFIKLKIVGCKLFQFGRV